MRRILPKTLFGQLVLGTLLVQALALGVFITYIVISQRHSAEDRTRVRTIQQLDRLARACEEPLEQGDFRGVHDALELSRIAPTIEVARLTDLQGHTLAVSDSGSDHGLDSYELDVLKHDPRQQVFKIRNGQLEAVTPIAVPGRPQTLLWIEPNHALSLTTANTIVRVALSYGGFALLSNLLPIFFLVRRMTKPLDRLRHATRLVLRNPERSEGFPLPVTTSNEAGQLTVSFNTMVRELEEQRSGLLETLALLDSMLGNAPIGFGFFDPELKYVRLNGFLADVTGLPVEEHLGRRMTEVVAGGLGVETETRLAEVFASGHAVRNVELSNGPGGLAGPARSWLMHFYPVRTNQDVVRWVGVIAVEITERLQAEEALRRTEKLAAAGRLAASIAHEINNPLEAVTNLLYLLRMSDGMDDTSMGYVGMAEAELARVSEITQQTLRFHRQSTSASRTRVDEVLDSVVKLYHPRIVAAQVAIERRFRGEPEVFGFGGELRQVFANLVGNAIDAMTDGGTLYVSVRRSFGVGGAGVRVSVADTGTGMSAETLHHVFEAFFTTKKATGTGLGLWVSEEIIRKHAGTVKVRSKVGHGTCFMMFFPDAGVGQG